MTGKDAAVRGDRLSDPRTLLGRVISGRYRIEELIGEGGMGAVYRAQHLQLHSSLAIKVLHPEMRGLTEAVARFDREAIAGAYIRHPNVAAASDFGKLEDGSRFLVLELLTGRDLRSLVAQGPIRLDRALKIARQIALALRAAHELGIVHRDLKPENVMLVSQGDETDFVKVFDFGIAKVPVQNLPPQLASSTSPLTLLGVAYGTPEYMAPEQALGEEIDGRADLYALGVILYEMLCGARPFDADSKVVLLGMVASKKPPPFAERVPGTLIPAPLEALVMRLLEKKPVARFASAEELVSAIDAAMQDVQGVASARTVLKQASMPPRAASRPSLMGLSAAQRLTTIPPAALLAAGGLVAISSIVVLAVVLRGFAGGAEQPRSPSTAPSASTASTTSSGAPTPAAAPANATNAAPSPQPAAPDSPAAPDPSKAPADELDAARIKGSKELTALAKKFPGDADLLRTLVVTYGQSSQGLGDAVRTAKKLFEIAPAKASDEDVQKVILRAASGKPGVADLAFEVMSRHMGNRGLDLIYELLIAPSVGKFTKDRAIAVLRNPEVRQRAPAALLIAYDLRIATACNRKQLFARARQDGDIRALNQLKPLTLTTGCGFFRRSDCYPCLGSRADLHATIKAMEERLQSGQR